MQPVNCYKILKDKMSSFRNMFCTTNGYMNMPEKKKRKLSRYNLQNQFHKRIGTEKLFQNWMLTQILGHAFKLIFKFETELIFDKGNPR